MFRFRGHKRNDNQRRMPNISKIYDDRRLAGKTPRSLTLRTRDDKQQELRQSGVNELPLAKSKFLHV